MSPSRGVFTGLVLRLLGPRPWMMTRMRAIVTGSLAWVGSIGITTGLLALAPSQVKSWAESLGLSPVVVVLGVMLWSLAWRGHNQVLAELAQIRMALTNLTLTLMGSRRGGPRDGDESDPP